MTVINNFQTNLTRGKFLSHDLDTNIKLTVDFDECPVQGFAEVQGELRAGLHMMCKDENDISVAQQNSTSKVKIGEAAEQDCVEAFSDAFAHVKAYLFSVNSNKLATANFTKVEYETARDQGFSVDKYNIFIEQYDTTGGGNSKIRETQICEDNSEKLNPDEINVASNSDGSALHVLGVTCPEDGSDDLKFNLAPFSFASADRFVVRYDIIAKKEDPSRRRRLLRITKRMVLQAGNTVTTAKSSGFQVLKLVSDTVSVDSSDGSGSGASSSSPNAPVKADAVPAEMESNEDATGSGKHDHADSDGSHEHTDLSVMAIVGISVGALVLVIGAGVLICNNASQQKRQRQRDGNNEEKNELLSEGMNDEEMNSYRFKNLRY